MSVDELVILKVIKVDINEFRVHFLLCRIADFCFLE